MSNYDKAFARLKEAFKNASDDEIKTMLSFMGYPGATEDEKLQKMEEESTVSTRKEDVSMPQSNAFTFAQIEELAKAANLDSNIKVRGEIAAKIMNDFEKVSDADFIGALTLATAIKSAQQMESDAAKAEAEAKAKAEEEQRNAWREILTGLNEKQKTVALYLKGVLQYTTNEGIIIIGQSIIDAIVNNEGSFQIAVRITMALDKAQNLNISNRQQYDKEIEDFLSDIGSIIRRNNIDSVIDKINKTFDTYIEMSAATPSEE